MINFFCRKGSELQEEPIQDKENVPPSFGQKPARKQRRVNRCNHLITRGKWISEALEEAMDVIENGITSLRKSSKHWNVSFISLSDHLYGKTRSRKPGSTCMLIVEDHVVVAWVLSM
jgi:hypothetical protein